MSKRSKMDTPVVRVAGFLNGLLSSIDISDDANLIELQGEALGVASEAKCVVVRPCYVPLFSFAEETLAVETPTPDQVHISRYAVITGTAGIGKTYFGLYAARKWFLDGQIVRLWSGSKCWIFARNLKDVDVMLRGKMSECQLSDGTPFWYLEGEDLEKELMTRSDPNVPEVYTIRDSGKEELDRIVNAGGPVLYTISSGHQKVLKALTQKTTMASFQFLRYAPLWDLEEFWVEAIVDPIIAIMTKMHEIQPWYTKKSESATATGSDDPYNNEHFRYEILVQEGFRRYGGSAREVIRFATYAADEIKEEKFDSADEATASAVRIADDSVLQDAITAVVEQQASNAKSVAKAKAIIFQRIPSDDFVKSEVVIATLHIRKLLLSASKVGNFTDISKLMAALQGTGQHQSPYGILYEPEAHKKLLGAPTLTLSFLGHHGPNAAMSRFKAKQNVTLQFPQLTVKVVLGRSLENLEVKPADSIESIYVLPFCTNFPSHDAFVFVKACEFYGVHDRLSVGARSAAQKVLEDAYVLVAFQMTVSGSGSYAEKPSHTLRGTHLKNHVDGLAGKVSPLLLDVVTIFVSPTETVRKIGAMPVLRATGQNTLVTRLQGVTDGVAPQYSVVVEDDYLTALIDDDHKGRPNQSASSGSQLF